MSTLSPDVCINEPTYLILRINACVHSKYKIDYVVCSYTCTFQFKSFRDFARFQFMGRIFYFIISSDLR